MKSLILRSSVALACALSLAGCGGSSGNLLLGGTVFGPIRDGLVLQNNGGTPYPIPAFTAFSQGFAFPDLLSNDQDFNVTIKTSPPSADCTVVNGKGRTGAFNITTVEVHCITHTFALGGQIVGLGNATGLVLVNGADRQAISAGAATLTMAKVADGSPYGVTILSQPAGLTCTVVNGVGTMGDKDVSNIQVNCA
jgi:hypothetical protein